MNKTTIELDETTTNRARKLADLRHCTVDELVRHLISEAPIDTAEGDLVGMLADEPELVDQIMQDVYRTRESQGLRTP